MMFNRFNTTHELDRQTPTDSIARQKPSSRWRLTSGWVVSDAAACQVSPGPTVNIVVRCLAQKCSRPPSSTKSSTTRGVRCRLGSTALQNPCSIRRFSTQSCRRGLIADRSIFKFADFDSDQSAYLPTELQISSGPKFQWSSSLRCNAVQTKNSCATETARSRYGAWIARACKYVPRRRTACVSGSHMQICNQGASRKCFYTCIYFATSVSCPKSDTTVVFSSLDFLLTWELS